MDKQGDVRLNLRSLGHHHFSNLAPGEVRVFCGVGSKPSQQGECSARRPNHPDMDFASHVFLNLDRSRPLFRHVSPRCQVCGCVQPTALSQSWHHWTDSPPHQFSEARARLHLRELADTIGVRVVGGINNELRATRYFPVRNATSNLLSCTMPSATFWSISNESNDQPCQAFTSTCRQVLNYTTGKLP